MIGALLASMAGCGPEARGPNPPSTVDRPASVTRGRALFLQHCAICHGERADGHGIRHQALSARPRDFTQPGWMRQLPPPALFSVIEGGKPGTSMPAWRALGDDTIWDLVSYLRTVPPDGTGP